MIGKEKKGSGLV